MRKYIILISLALTTLACVVLEGLVELPVQFIQFNGLLTIVCTGIYVIGTLKMHVGDFSKD